jgi:DNA-binding MarR family transcriptional regulator
MKVAKIEAFKDQINSGQMQTNKIKIYNLIKEQPSTISRLRDISNIPHQTLTGALSGLEELGWVYRLDDVKVKNRTYTLYAAETDLEKAKRNALLVEREKFLDWMYRGEKNGWFDEYDVHLEWRAMFFKKAIENVKTMDGKGNGYTP